MPMDNKFGKISRISACAALKDGKTILRRSVFHSTIQDYDAPSKKENGGIQIMPLCASAGIMAGDSQKFSYHVKEGADLEVLSQSFEKIHKMDEGSAARTIEVQVDKNATLYYYPQPVIPFAQSAFDSKMTIHLEDATSRLFLLEIISCGRNAHDERFQYRRFSSKVLLYRGDKLIYRDNTATNRTKCPWKESECTRADTHMANLFLSKICSRDGENCSQESGTVKTADSTINLELQEKKSGRFLTKFRNRWRSYPSHNWRSGIENLRSSCSETAAGSGKKKKYTKMNGHKSGGLPVTLLCCLERSGTVTNIMKFVNRIIGYFE